MPVSARYVEATEATLTDRGSPGLVFSLPPQQYIVSR